MAAGPEILEFKDRVDATFSDLQSLRVKLDEFARYTKTAAEVVQAVDDTGDAAEDITKVIDDQLSLLKITKLAGPLKAPSKVFEKVLETVRPVSDKIDKAVDRLNGKTDKNQDGNLLDNIETVLSDSSALLTVVSGQVLVQEVKLGDLSDTMGDYIKALNVATSGEFGGAFDGLSASIEGRLSTRNDVAAEIDDLYASLVSKIEGIVGIMDDARLDLALSGGVSLGEVSAFFDVIAKPLDAAAAALKPVEPMLDTVGFVVDAILGPVFSFLTSTLGIDALLEGIAEDIASKFPKPTFFNDFSDSLQAMIDDLRDFLSPEGFGVDAMIDKIEDGLFGGDIGDHISGPMGYGTDGDDLFLGHSGSDILDGRAGNDSIRGSAGNDIFIASEGDDRIDGGSGTDLIYFDGFLSEYEIFTDPETGWVTVTHVKPPVGGKNEGSETFKNIDHVVFKNIKFTGAELETARTDPSILYGTDQNDLIFLNTGADTDDDANTNTVDGYHVVEAGAGNDRIFGTSENDRLEGEDGDDIFIPGGGADIVNGGSGSDTFQVLAEATSQNYNGFLEQGQIQQQGGTNNTVSSIENMIIQIRGDHDLYGTDDDSYIISSTGDDVISGRGGDDFIEAGDGDDYIIGGAGEDQIFGGKGNDYIATGEASVAGQSEYYDGGEGADELSYSNWRPSVPNVALDTRVKVAFDEIEDGPSAGALRYIADDGTVEHLDQNGSVIATDTVVDIESLIGSQYNDVLYGVTELGDRPTYISGSGGEDILYANAASGTYGGDGDDLVIMSELHLTLGLQNITYSGGAGTGDVFDMSVLNDTRLYLEATGTSGGGKLRAYETSKTGMLQTGGSIITANVGGFELLEFTDNDDRLKFDPGGTGTFGTFKLGGGDDQIEALSGTVTIEGNAGADTIQFSGSGTFRGGNGNDSGTWDSIHDDLVIEGGKGQDQFTLRRFEGEVKGGKGFDTVSIFGNVSMSQRSVEVDMVAGTIATRSITTGDLDGNVIATISSIEQVVGTVHNDDFDGSDGNDQFVGRGGIDVFTGLAGNDTFYGGDGNDRLFGGDGNDLLHGGAGNDVIYGGAGIDTVSYANAVAGELDGSLKSGIFGNMLVVLGTDTVSGSQGSDLLVGIENVIGSNGNDTIIGTNVGNLLSGGLGNDLLSGEGGDDVLVTGRGNDTAYGGTGDDTIVIDAGAKTIAGNGGTDTLDFGTASGTVNLNFSTDSYSAEFVEFKPVWVDNGGTEVRQFRGDLLTPQLIREIDPLFSNSEDDLTRSVETNVPIVAAQFRIRDVAEGVTSTGTWDSIEHFTGGAAGTILTLSNGIDRFDGSRSDQDFIDLADHGAGIEYNFVTGATDAQILSGDELVGVEGIYATAFGDTIIGNALDNVIYGYDGDDMLRGSGGDDQVFDGKGNDTVRLGVGDDFLRVGGGRDNFIGGIGEDYISYYDSTGGIRIDLRDNEVSGSWAGNDTITGFESASGSRTGDDTMFGTSGSNTLKSFGGNDRVFDRDGDDRVELGAGNDFVRVGGGKDSYDGGSGQDYISYYDSVGGIRIDLRDNEVSGSWAGNDTINSFESASGSQTGDDTMLGTATANTLKSFGGDDRLNGRGGNDKLYGGSGDDFIDGGAGFDILFGGTGRDVFHFDFGDDNDIIKDFENNVDTIELDNFVFGVNQDAFDFATQTGADVVFNFGDGDVLTVEDATIGQLRNDLEIV